MIQSRDDLRFYLKEDAKRANLENRITYFIKVIYGNEQPTVFAI